MVKLQEALGPLRKELEEALELMSKEQKKSMNWQGVKSALIRREHMTLQPPEAVSPVLKNGYEICFDMREMLARFTRAQPVPGPMRHQEALKLLCEEDQTPISVVCDRSRAHRARTVVAIEEAAQEYKLESLLVPHGPWHELSLRAQHQRHIVKRVVTLDGLLPAGE
ncbi:unnamed protein product [Eretmochelys imbricata]